MQVLPAGAWQAGAVTTAPRADEAGADRLTILHVDMDAFYASVEVLDDPTLAGRPVIVGGSGDRGVVASCSYEARAWGVRSAMPSARARRLCPDAVFRPGRFERYAELSGQLHDIFLGFTPLVERISLDEAFLDVAGARRLLGSGPEIAAAIRQRILGEMGLPASVGVATCKFIAKMASVAAKPSAAPTGPVPGVGVWVVAPGQELAFLHPHPVRALWGVGPATHRRLDRFGVRTVGDLAALPVDALVGALGPALGRHLHELAWGRDRRPVVPERVVKSIGHEETFATDLRDHDVLHVEVVRQSDAVATRMRKAAVAGRTVTLKVRFHDFRTITRSRTAPAPVDTGRELARLAGELLASVDCSEGVRLLGVSASNLVERGAEQLSLGAMAGSGDGSGNGPGDGSGGGSGGGPAGGTGNRSGNGSGGGGNGSGSGSGAEPVARAMDDVRRRFGDAAVGPASLIGTGGLKLKRQGDQQWGPSAPPPE
ncbi:MAG: polymerase [Actinomycetota bacterium]|nr:polymerase [Actinomycetota bacterium]